MNTISALVIVAFSAVFSSLITAKIIAIRYLKLMDDYIEKNLELTKELINWAKGLDKHQ